MVDPRAEASVLRNWRAFTAGVVSAIVVVTAWATLAPWQVEVAEPIAAAAFDPTFGILEIDSEASLQALVVGTIAMIVGAAAWLVVVQRRSSWPFRRHPAKPRVVPRRALHAISFLPTYLLATIGIDPIARVTGLRHPPIAGMWIRLSLPADGAIHVVLAIAGCSVVYLSVWLLVHAMLQSWDPDVPPVRLIEPAADRR